MAVEPHGNGGVATARVPWQRAANSVHLEAVEDLGACTQRTARGWRPACALRDILHELDGLRLPGDS